MLQKSAGNSYRLQGSWPLSAELSRRTRRSQRNPQRTVCCSPWCTYWTHRLCHRHDRTETELSIMVILCLSLLSGLKQLSFILHLFLHHRSRYQQITIFCLHTGCHLSYIYFCITDHATNRSPSSAFTLVTAACALICAALACCAHQIAHAQQPHKPQKTSRRVYPCTKRPGTSSGPRELHCRRSNGVLRNCLKNFIFSTNFKVLGLSPWNTVEEEKLLLTELKTIVTCLTLTLADRTWKTCNLSYIYFCWTVVYATTYTYADRTETKLSFTLYLHILLRLAELKQSHHLNCIYIHS